MPRDSAPTDRSQRSIVLEFLGSMNLAITVLVAVAIASVIGTVLKQNQPYTDYIIKFGPFWHDVFRTLGLYNVYAAFWFLALLGFLLVTTSVCVYRNGPTMLRDMRHFRMNLGEKSLRVMRNSREWQLPGEPQAAEQTVREVFSAGGYRTREKRGEGRYMVAGMKGGLGRLGYLLSHVGVIVICLGALVDGNLALKLKEMSGDIRIETRDIPASQVPEISRLKPSDSLSFRGSVTVPEGSAANLVFLNLRDGYLVQELPFSVHLKDFRIEHYPSGKPKSFESDLVIRDPSLDKPLERTISVNHPLIYKGYAIYQASFGDGGSDLKMKAWPLDTTGAKPTAIEGRVHSDQMIQTPAGPRKLEISDFRPFNIFPAPEDDPSGKKFVNFGPNFTFKLRDPSGAALEYVNYMAPVRQDGRLYYLTGVRGSPAEDFRYLHIPADPKGSLDRFLTFERMLHDPERVRTVASREAAQALDGAKLTSPELRKDVVNSMVRLVTMFAKGGFGAIGQQIEKNVPKDRQEKVAAAYMKILQNTLQAVYIDLLEKDEGKQPEQFTEADDAFYNDAVNAIAGLSMYGSPVFLQLTDFNQVQASGLEITRSPGKNIVYLGSAMLILGIFFMFYINHRRLWALVIPESGGTRLLVAGAGNRHQEEFAREFQALETSLERRLQSGYKDQYRN